MAEVLYRRGPLAFYQGGDDWEELAGSAGDARPVDDLDLVAVGLREVRFEGQLYKLEREGLYRFTVFPQRIRNLIALHDTRSPLPLLKALPRLQIHGNRHNKAPNLREKLKHEPWVSIYCGVVHKLFNDILREHGFRAREIAVKTSQEHNTFDNGHCLQEVFFPEHRKWLLVDADIGVLFKDGERFLSAYELLQQAREGRQPQFVPLARKEVDPFFSDSASGQEVNYVPWMRCQLSTDALKWAWYRRVFQNLTIHDGGRVNSTEDTARLLRECYAEQ